MAIENAAQIASGLSALGTCVAIALFASQIPMMRTMMKEGDAGSYTKVPTYLLLGTTVQWMLYALFVQGRWDLFAVNAIGVAFCVTYVGLFAAYSQGASRRTIMQVGVGIVGAAVLMYVALFKLLPAGVLPSRALIVALVADLVNTAMFASPLQSVHAAVLNLDASRVPALLTLASLLCGLNWSAFGIVIDDYFVAAPNMIGSILSLLQLVALGYIRVQNNKVASKATVVSAANVTQPHEEHATASDMHRDDSAGILMHALPDVNTTTLTPVAEEGGMHASDSAQSLDGMHDAVMKQESRRLMPATAAAITVAAPTPREVPHSDDHVGIDMDDVHATIQELREDAIRRSASSVARTARRGMSASASGTTELRVRAASSGLTPSTATTAASMSAEINAEQPISRAPSVRLRGVSSSTPKVTAGSATPVAAASPAAATPRVGP